MWHVFESTREDSRPKILLTKSVRNSLLTYLNIHSLIKNKNRFILALAMQSGKGAANRVLFRFGEGNIQFFRVVFQINPLLKIRGDVSITDFVDKC